jgi:hypothetical protein
MELTMARERHVTTEKGGSYTITERGSSYRVRQPTWVPFSPRTIAETMTLGDAYEAIKGERGARTIKSR